MIKKIIKSNKKPKRKKETKIEIYDIIKDII